MTRQNRILIASLAAVLASACAQTGVTRIAYAPRGQAAEPGSWSPSASAASVTTPDGSAQGQAAQPGSWIVKRGAAAEPRAYVTGVPAGQASQPQAWIKTSL